MLSLSDTLTVTIKMEFGRVTTIKSKYLNDSVVVYRSSKHPSHVYKSSRKKDNEYLAADAENYWESSVLSLL